MIVSLAQQTLQDPDARSCIRSAADLAGSTCPVVAVPGSARPRVGGEPGYYTTPSGKTIVRHPGAYKWRTVYHCSTLYIAVGADWVRRHCPVPYAQACADRVDTAVERFERHNCLQCGADLTESARRLRDLYGVEPIPYCNDDCAYAHQV